MPRVLQQETDAEDAFHRVYPHILFDGNRKLPGLIKVSPFLDRYFQNTRLAVAGSQPNAGLIRQFEGEQFFDAFAGRELSVNFCVKVLIIVAGAVFYFQVKVVNGEGIFDRKSKVQRIVLSPVSSGKFILFVIIVSRAAGKQEEKTD